MPNAIVIGAGIIGSGCAAALSKAGWSVSVIDRHTPGSGCSFGNAGLIAPSLFPLASPSTLRQLGHLLTSPRSPLSIHPLYVIKHMSWFIQFFNNCSHKRYDENVVALHEIATIARSSYEQLLGNDTNKFLVDTGYLIIFETQEAYSAAQQLAKIRQSFGAIISTLNRAELEILVPGISPSIIGGLHIKNASYVRDLGKLIRRLLNSSNVLVGEAISIDDKQTKKARIVMEEGDAEADLVVIANGVDAGRLCNSLGYRPKLLAERGYHVTIPNNSNITLPIMSAEGGFVITPMSTGLRVAGLSEFSPMHSAPAQNRIQHLINVAKHVIPSLNIDVESTWIGNRPATPDSRPLIKRIGKSRRVILATGHGHAGVTLAAVTGLAVTKMAEEIV